MTVPLSSAVAAYANTAAGSAAPGMAPREEAPGASFADMVKSVAGDALAAGQQAERMSVAAIEGKADVNEVVAAVANAEMTLQTVVAVRDKVVEAYQTIMRMPI